MIIIFIFLSILLHDTLAAAPSDLTYTDCCDYTFYIDEAISNLSPSSSGDAVDTYSDGSGLPVGLDIDAATGIISGTPTTLGSGTVTITATNTDGSTTIDLSVNIVDRIAQIAYDNSKYTFTIGSSITKHQ